MPYLDYWGWNNYAPDDVGIDWVGGGRSTSVKRTGTHSLSVGASNATYIRKLLGANYATLYYGFAVYFESLPGTRNRMASFSDGSSYQISLTVEADGSLRLWRGLAGGFDGIGGATSLQQSSAGVFHAATWHHVQIKVTFHGSTGSYEVKLDSSTLLSGSSANTITSANAYANRIGLGDVVPGYTQYFDDVWITDIGFKGDCAVEGTLPNANGAVNNFAASGAASAYLACDDAASKNDDTDYASSGTPGDVQLFDLNSLVATTGSVIAAKVWAAMRKDDAGARDGALVVYSNATQSVRSTVALTSTYVYYYEVLLQDPTDTQSWSIAKATALQAGVKVIS